MYASYPFDIGLLPPSQSFDSPALLKAIMSAHVELAELKGYTNGVLSPEILFLISIREAIASAKIDNISTSVESVFKQSLLSDDEQLINEKNIINYTYVVKNGSVNSKKFYLSEYGIKNMHINISNESSEFRDYGNFIENPIFGKPFWSPSSNQVPYLIEDWEQFINSSDATINPLIKTILCYYQLEAIHPFDDTCGRVSRMSLLIHLAQEKIINYPALLISEYLEANNVEYFRLMRAVTTKYEWNNFIIFMLHGFELQARATREKISQLLEHLDGIINKIHEIHGATFQELANHIFTFPVTTAENLMRSMEIDYELSSSYLDKLADNGLLNIYVVSNEKFYYNQNLLNLLKH